MSELQGMGQCGPVSRPDHWIGIEADYQSHDDHPASRLVSISRRDLGHHNLILGRTGSGKTVALTHLISGAILRGDSFVVIDPRGDQVHDVLTLLAGRVDPSLVKVVNLRDSSPLMGFDPLSGSGLPHQRALNVLSTVKANADSFGVQLEETARHFLEALTEVGEPLTQLEPAFYEDGYRSWLLTRIETDSTRNFIIRYHEMRDDRKATLASPVMNKFSGLFATRKLRAILSDRNPIDLYSHLNQDGSILLVSLAIDETSLAGRAMGSMIFGSLIQAMYSRIVIPELQRNPVLLVLDEFSHFATEDIDSVLIEGRKFGCHAILAHQSLCQLSPKLKSLALGNVGQKLIFGLGRDDAQMLSADLTGDRKAIDFTRLPVGSCILKRGNKELVGVEINTPIGNGGVLDSNGRKFLAQIHDAHANKPYQAPVLPIGQPTEKKKPRTSASERPTCSKPETSLEDWF